MMKPSHYLLIPCESAAKAIEITGNEFGAVVWQYGVTWISENAPCVILQADEVDIEAIKEKQASKENV